MQREFDGKQRFRHAEHIAWRKVDDEAVLLDQNTSDYFSINNVGVLIWENLGKGACLDEIAAAICEEFSVEPTQARKHLEEFVQELCQKKVLIPSSR
jgi:hypothetical protein